MAFTHPTGLITLGNAALCIANVARHPALLPELALRVAAAPPAPSPGAEANEGADLGEGGRGVPTPREAEGCLVAALLRVAYAGAWSVLRGGVLVPKASGSP